MNDLTSGLIVVVVSKKEKGGRPGQPGKQEWLAV